MKTNRETLFIIVLGGRNNVCNIELHDVRWAIGETIEDTFHQLRSEWFGNQKGLHIDSYVAINYIDGYKIDPIRISSCKNDSKTIITDNSNSSKNKKLWFVNLGGYVASHLYELHQFGLIVSSTRVEAKQIAKTRWLKRSTKQHIDDIKIVDEKRIINTCNKSRKADKWIIKIDPDPLQRSQILQPDWNGYMRIDNDNIYKDK